MHPSIKSVVYRTAQDRGQKCGKSLLKVRYRGFYALRSITNKDLKVPEKPKLKCMGFTYNGAKLVQHATTSNEGNQRPKYSQTWH